MKSTLSIAELTQLLATSVSNIAEVIEDGAKVSVSDPQVHADDELGRNWNVSFIKNGARYGNEIRDVVEELRLKYRLQT
jgi:hypothetical protein